ncbi:MAG: FHA domain-containing protein [Muribaculaceae bacterium]|nr:FHA domain-containing protein [Muribaculaceae bacterium]
MDIKIACPTCGHKYNLKAPNPTALAGRTFTCPKCNNSAPFGQILQRAGITVPSPAAGQRQGASPGAHPSTNLGGVQQGPRTMPHHGYSGGAKTMAHSGNPSHGMSGIADPVGSTQYFGNPAMGAVPAKQCYLVIRETGRAIPLKPGQYIMGRDSSDSGATMRIAPDPYMSRRHAHLSVAVGVDGIMRLTITGMNSQNDIFINSCRLYPGASAAINPGDEILLGMTNLKYVVK